MPDAAAWTRSDPPIVAILAAEPVGDLDLSAEIDLTGECRIAVLQSHPQRETRLARECCIVGLPYYLPLGVVERHDGKQVRRRTTPLFSSYLFVYGDWSLLSAVARSPYHASRLEVADQRRILHELRQVDQLVRSGQPVLPEPELRPGQLVTVRSGPYQGVTGTVAEIKSERWLIVWVDTLGQRCRVRFERGVVEPVGC